MLARRMMRRLRSSAAPPVLGDSYYGNSDNGNVWRAAVDADGLVEMVPVGRGLSHPSRGYFAADEVAVSLMLEGDPSSRVAKRFAVPPFDPEAPVAVAETVDLPGHYDVLMRSGYLKTPNASSTAKRYLWDGAYLGDASVQTSGRGWRSPDGSSALGEPIGAPARTQGHAAASYLWSGYRSYACSPAVDDPGRWLLRMSSSGAIAELGVPLLPAASARVSEAGAEGVPVFSKATRWTIATDPIQSKGGLYYVVDTSDMEIRWDGTTRAQDGNPSQLVGDVSMSFMEAALLVRVGADGEPHHVRTLYRAASWFPLGEGLINYDFPAADQVLVRRPSGEIVQDPANFGRRGSGGFLASGETYLGVRVMDDDVFVTVRGTVSSSVRYTLLHGKTGENSDMSVRVPHTAFPGGSSASGLQHVNCLEREGVMVATAPSGPVQSKDRGMTWHPVRAASRFVEPYHPGFTASLIPLA